MIKRREVVARIAVLRRELSRHIHLYHNQDRPEISDAAFDALKNELVELEKLFPDLVTPDSPTQRVGGIRQGKFNKVTHTKPMLSLADAFSEEEMREWEARIRKICAEKNVTKYSLDYYAELKMDGLAISLVYEKGNLIRAATRGDGQVGENVTANLRTIPSVPLRLLQPSDNELKKIGLKDSEIKQVRDMIVNGKLEVRGEAIMTLDNLKRLNKVMIKSGKPPFANTRNAAAGSIRQLDPNITASRGLVFYVYALLMDDKISIKHETEHLLADLLGFKIFTGNRFCKNLDEVLAFHKYWEKHRDKLTFECDGVVTAVNNEALWPILGATGKSPRYMIAYKFPAEQATTIVKNIEWHVGRTGVLTPTASLEPVKVKGVMISNTTLHNYDEIKRLDVRIGDTVIIERAGDVIPKIIEVLKNLRPKEAKQVSPPKKCPMCGSLVSRFGEEVAYKCNNKSCYAVNRRRLIHWASKAALDIEGLGPAIVDQLLKVDLIADPADFYNLTQGDLLPLERFGEKSVTNLLEAINNSKQVSLSKIIQALGIAHVGEETALMLEQELPKLAHKKKLFIKKPSDLFKIMDKLKKEDLTILPDVGDKVAESILGWFKEEKNRQFLNKLDEMKMVIMEKKEKIKTNNKLVGLSFVLTGTLPTLSRDEAKELIRQAGGTMSSSVSKNTSYVIVGDKPGSKYQEAKKLGVKIIGEEELKGML